MESRIASRANEKGASRMDFLGVGSVRAGPHPVCQQRRPLDDGIFRIERAWGINNVCTSLDIAWQILAGTSSRDPAERIGVTGVQPSRAGRRRLLEGRLSRSPK